MKILVVSDTHGRDSHLEEAVLAEAPFEYLIHCGDVEGREIFIEALAECPCFIVAGNNDFFSDLPREEIVKIAGKKILVTHGHYYGVSMDVYSLLDEAKDRDCDVVMFGHTHRPFMEKMDGVWIINPGSLSYPRQNGRLPSYAVVELEEGKDLSAEIRYL